MEAVKKDVQANLTLLNIKQHPASKIKLATTGGSLYVEPNAIMYVKAEDDISTLYTKNANYRLTKSLKETEAILVPFNFYRCHRSYLVNLKEIKFIVKNANSIIHLQNGDHLPLARKRKKEVEVCLEKLWVT